MKWSWTCSRHSWSKPWPSLITPAVIFLLVSRSSFSVCKPAGSALTDNQTEQNEGILMMVYQWSLYMGQEIYWWHLKLVWSKSLAMMNIRVCCLQKVDNRISFVRCYWLMCYVTEMVEVNSLDRQEEWLFLNRYSWSEEQNWADHHVSAPKAWTNNADVFPLA